MKEKLTIEKLADDILRYLTANKERNVGTEELAMKMYDGVELKKDQVYAALDYIEDHDERIITVYGTKGMKWTSATSFTEDFINNGGFELLMKQAQEVIDQKRKDAELDRRLKRDQIKTNQEIRSDIKITRGIAVAALLVSITVGVIQLVQAI